MILIGFILTAAALSNITEDAVQEAQYRRNLRKINRRRKNRKPYPLEYDREWFLYGR